MEPAPTATTTHLPVRHTLAMTRDRKSCPYTATVSSYTNNAVFSLLGSKNACLSAPTGVNWQRVEIDNPQGSIITFCNVGCQGSGSALQNGNCLAPFPGCAIGSL